MKIFVTGGAGFIGSHFIRNWIKKNKNDKVITYDKLTYAGNLDNLKEVKDNPRHKFIRGDIADGKLLQKVLKGVDAIVNFAAETHVDRSLLDASAFIQTNIQGTYVLVNTARQMGIKKFLHISTDEVYGSIKKGKTPEDYPLNPSSPYAASKAASDHLVMTQWHTYRYPVMITRCTNNFGPYQYPEKFLPLFITNALENKPLPMYGKGLNVRNWIHVADHCEAVGLVLKKGKPGEIYNIAADQESRNIDVAKAILSHLGRPKTLLTYVKDRPGHDFRYAPDIKKIQKQLGWKQKYPFEKELPGLINWYWVHRDWWKKIKYQQSQFKNYFSKQYKKRLGKKELTRS